MQKTASSFFFLSLALLIPQMACDEPSEEETPTPPAGETPSPDSSPSPTPGATMTPKPEPSPTPGVETSPTPEEEPTPLDETPSPTPNTMSPCSLEEDGASDPFIDCVVSYDPPMPPEEMYGYESFPDVVYGSPEGDEAGGGGTDVLSLGCGGSIVVYFAAPAIVDGEGTDFIVFENPFYYGETTFAEPAQVSVSEDGIEWFTFPCEVDGEASWPPAGCAGVYPVYAGSGNDLDPTDPDVAGGDAFDLSVVGLERARYVRLEDRTVEYYGDETWCGTSGGFDLDAISIVHQESVE